MCFNYLYLKTFTMAFICGLSLCYVCNFHFSYFIMNGIEVITVSTVPYKCLGKYVYLYTFSTNMFKRVYILT